MTVTFTATDFQTALIELQQRTDIIYQLSEHELTLTLPKPLGSGRLQNVNLREGSFNLFIRQHLLDENVVIAAAGTSPARSPVALKFFVSGSVNGAIQGIKANMDTVAGQYCLAYCADQNSHMEFIAGKEICTVEIVMALPLFQTMLGEDPQLAQLQRQFSADILVPYWEFGTTTPLMATAVQQVLQCPYQGATRRLYLESKSLELILLVLEHLKIRQPEAKKRRPLKPDDVKVIYQARDILINQIEDPPSLLSLARQVGINDCKLKQGFRQVFGTTVFGYLHNYRMERAAELLQRNQMTVTGVASSIGFASRSAFAVAFRRKFGLNPSDYRAAYHRQYWNINPAQNAR
ncbi:MAG: AraC family transcriptional regulator [Cyanobacteria bacterium P01_F01_bin.150]